MKKKLLVPIFLAAMAMPLCLPKQPVNILAEYIGTITEKSEYLKYGVEVNGQMANEGFVLLKNDGTLPLDEGAMVSVVGRSSVSLALGGGGSGSASTSSGVTEINNIRKSLENAGFEVNPVTDDFYKNKAGGGRTNGNDNWKGNSEVTIGETAIEKVEAADGLLDSLDEYNDAVIQVITREGSEGCDVKTCNAHDTIKTNSSNKAVSHKHALELSDNEQALFDMLHEHFDHIIIVINSSNIFECDQFETDDQVAGVLWIGNPGDVGAGAVGRILSGEVNPSGRTVDTWTRDFEKDPSFQNFSDNSQTNLMEINGEEYYVPQDTMFAEDGAPMLSFGTDQNYKNHSSPRWDSARGGEVGKVVSGGINGVKPAAYVSYEEGIYVDYRYYETRYADMALEDKAAADEWYNGEEGVVYPFGYGLSYTTFDQKILRVAPGKDAILDENSDLIEVSVRVTNTGDVAGKDAVQLYWRAPYTKGGIEKADHVLCAFGKSKVLDPGESQVLQLTFHLQDVANYDFSDANHNEFKGYELDEGTYNILLGKNAHEAYGKVDLQVINGGIKYETDRFTGYKVENRFTDNGFYSCMPGEDDIEFTQMSRADFVETFPTHPTIEDRTVKHGSRFEEFLTHEFSVAELDEGNYEYIPEAAVRTEQDFIDNGWEQNGKYGVKLSEMKGLDLDDPKWEELVNGVTWNDMLGIVENNRMSSSAISGIGKNSFSEGDGPQKMKSSGGIFWVSSPIIAATFNQDLAHKQGECCGMESNLSGGQAGWWGPACNTHRSPFGGRNFEYYSADPFLMGRIAAEVVGGATDRGVYCYFKHFATNDQEKNRESGISFLTEQALREIYLKSFQMVFEEGRTIGVMGSYNRMGLMETAANYELLTNVVRNEWGFQGSVLSDMTHSGNSSVNFKCYENINNRILAGCNAQLDSGGFSGKSEAKWESTLFGGKGAPAYTKNNQKIISWSYWYAVRQMTKGHLYMSINCSGQGKQIVKSNGTQELEAKIGADISIDVNEYFEGSAAEYKINERRGRNALPEGLEMDANGVITGKLENAGLYRFDIIAYGAPNQPMAAVQIALTIVPDEADYNEDLMDIIDNGSGNNNNGGKKGCFGDMTAVGTLAGVLALAGLAVILTSIKKRKEA